MRCQASPRSPAMRCTDPSSAWRVISHHAAIQGLLAPGNTSAYAQISWQITQILDLKRLNTIAMLLARSIQPPQLDVRLWAGSQVETRKMSLPRIVDALRRRELVSPQTRPTSWLLLAHPACRIRDRQRCLPDHRSGTHSAQYGGSRYFDRIIGSPTLNIWVRQCARTVVAPWHRAPTGHRPG